MKYLSRLILSLGMLAFGFAALPVSAQYPNYVYTYPNSSNTYQSNNYQNQYQPVTVGCLVLTKDLSSGMRDNTAGGEILRLQQFLVQQGYMSQVGTGQFGPNTLAAVRRFQAANQVPSTGYVGILTRALVYNKSCANGGYPNLPTTSVPVISGLSSYSGQVGSTITIYGSGFDYYSNTVNFGGVSVQANSSSGNSLTFVVPQTYNNNYNYNNTQICSQTYPYNCYYTNGNNYNYGSSAVQISVRNTRGTSNVVSFTVTNGSTYGGALSIGTVIGPTTLSTGAQGTWSFVVNNPGTGYVTANVRYGDENLYYTTNSSNNSQSIYGQTQQTLTFTHTYQTPGTYTIYFTLSNSAGQQTSTTLTVVVSGYSYNQYPNTNNQFYLSSFSPSQARIGNVVTLFGMGLASSNNIIHFGNGIITNVSSTDTSLYFTVPYYLNYCNTFTNSYCPTNPTPVVAGTYPVYVTNSLGQSNVLYFTVIQ